ncbi:MAG TPA: hypothetical protein VH601_24005 [Bryobacteraceae bacterium]|jgi:hypothetical protein
MSTKIFDLIAPDRHNWPLLFNPASIRMYESLRLRARWVPMKQSDAAI